MQTASKFLPPGYQLVVTSAQLLIFHYTLKVKYLFQKLLLCLIVYVLFLENQAH